MLTQSSHTTLLPIAPAAIDPPRRPRPIGAVLVQLGFPSPAEDFADDALDLNELLIRNEPATFFYRASGSSMRDVGILDGDFLVVDRSAELGDGALVLAVWEGNAPACKILRLFASHLELHSANPEHTPIVFGDDAEVAVFAVVGVVRKLAGSWRPCRSFT